MYLSLIIKDALMAFVTHFLKKGVKRNDEFPEMHKC